jgi:2-polyprenyl-3-methyl-5-hydroxy-6-metoxy-1,4-benzoquinol methylase
MHVIEELYGPGHAWVSDWVRDLPREYFVGFDSFLRETYYPGFPPGYLDTASGNMHIQGQVFVRLSQARDSLIPWIEKAVPLAGKRIMEVGCGTGSSTIPLLFAGAHVHALDIGESSIRSTRKRCELIGAPGEAKYETISGDWLTSDSAYDWSAVDADMVVCYALLNT